MSNLETIETSRLESMVNEEIEIIDNIKQELELTAALDCLRKALRDGILDGSSDFTHALSAAREFNCPEFLLVMIHLNDCENLSLPSDIAQAMVESISPLFSQKGNRLNSVCHFNWGRFLFHNKFIVEAEHVLKNSIKLDPKQKGPWIELGNLFRSDQQRYEEAEQAYRKAIDLDPKDAGPWSNLGTLLHYELNRYQEAEQACRTAIDLDPKEAGLWINLGDLLQFELNRYEEAEQAYRTAIELDPKKAWPWNNLGVLQANLNRYEEAEQAYRTAIELDPKEAGRWMNLGNLLQTDLNRFEEAEQAYRTAIVLDPKNAGSWNNLGNLLQDHLARLEDAETAYLQAIELDTETVFPKANLAYLLLSQSARVEAAEAAYTEAIALLPEHGRNLLTAYRALARDNFGEASENLRKVLEKNHPALFTEDLDDLLRLLRLAKTRGYGERLRGFLRESGLAERHWPLSAAFDAYLYGEEQLRDVNPEVRDAAKQIFDGLTATPDAKPQTPSPAATRKRGQKKPRLA